MTSTTPTVSPSRSTVARSQTAEISIIRWEMKMTERSPPRIRPMTSSTRSVRFAGSAAVISSSMRTSGSMASARARSTIRSDRERHLACLAREVEVPEPQLVDPVAERLDRRLGQAQVRPQVQVRDERRLLVHGDEAAVARLGRGVDDALAAPDGDPPAVGPDGAGQDLDERALAGAVGAHERVDLAGTHGERRGLQRDDRAVGLGDVRRLQQEVGGDEGHQRPVGTGCGGPAEADPPLGVAGDYSPGPLQATACSGV